MIYIPKVYSHHAPYWYQDLNMERVINKDDEMKGSFLGPKFDNNEIQKVLDTLNANYHKRDDYAKVRNYVDFFDTRIAALTSDKENIDKLTKFFKTKYELVDPDKPGFLVEHSSNIYILDKSLQVKKIIPNGIPSEEITVMLKKYL